MKLLREILLIGLRYIAVEFRMVQKVTDPPFRRLNIVSDFIVTQNQNLFAIKQFKSFLQIALREHKIVFDN